MICINELTWRTFAVNLVDINPESKIVCWSYHTKHIWLHDTICDKCKARCFTTSGIMKTTSLFNFSTLLSWAVDFSPLTCLEEHESYQLMLGCYYKIWFFSTETKVLSTLHWAILNCFREWRHWITVSRWISTLQLWHVHHKHKMVLLLGIV